MPLMEPAVKPMEVYPPALLHGALIKVCRVDVRVITPQFT